MRIHIKTVSFPLLLPLQHTLKKPKSSKQSREERFVPRQRQQTCMGPARSLPQWDVVSQEQLCCFLGTLRTTRSLVGVPDLQSDPSLNQGLQRAKALMLRSGPQLDPRLGFPSAGLPREGSGAMGLCPHALGVPVPWGPSPSRSRFLGRATVNGSVHLTTHFPFPQLHFSPLTLGDCFDPNPLFHLC